MVQAEGWREDDDGRLVLISLYQSTTLKLPVISVLASEYGNRLEDCVS